MTAEQIREPRADLGQLPLSLLAGLADDLTGGLELARQSLDDGRAAGVLERLVAASNAAAEAER